MSYKQSESGGDGGAMQSTPNDQHILTADFFYDVRNMLDEVGSTIVYLGRPPF